VRAWLALADSAWIHGERNTALRRYRKVRSLCAQYRLSELFLHVALNEAQLLQQMDRNESALALLNPLRNQFLLSKHCLALFLTLGRCFMKQANYSEATRVLEEGLRCPQAEYSAEGVAPLQTLLAKANLQANRTYKSRSEIERVLAANLAPQERYEQLTHLLLVVGSAEAMKKSNIYETERLLNEIEEYAKLHNQWSWVRTAHERLGAALWDIDRKAAIPSLRGRNDEDRGRQKS
ncbi:MAG: hypothetical protein AB7P69_23225, partial [Candidatus Binatia bacterium]